MSQLCNIALYKGIDKLLFLNFTMFPYVISIYTQQKVYYCLLLSTI